MRELEFFETWKLRDCLMQLADYHNEVSAFFKGDYPRLPCDESLSEFEIALKKKTSHIAVIEDKHDIIGFCKVDFFGENGKLDYLFVSENYRGKGYGGEFMNWAMSIFSNNNVRRIEVKVVNGNPAIHLYEKYGFKVKSLLMETEK